MNPDLRLVEKGRGQPRGALAQEGKVHVALVKHHALALADHGWSVVDTVAFEAQVEALETAVGSQADVYGEVGNSSDAESQTVDAAKAFVRKLRNALPRALRDSPAAGVTAQSFLAGEEMARSTPKLSAYFTKIRPSVVKLDPALKAHFKGQTASVLLDGVKKALDDADKLQELWRKNAPALTQALYEQMGRVLEGIEDINRAGRSAFDGDAVTAATFNKDVLLRGRKAEKKAAGKGDAPEGGDAPKVPVAPGAPGAPNATPS
ncbi:MAG: hypothetical protein ABI193_22470 [Minicystis sp.]